MTRGNVTLLVSNRLLTPSTTIILLIRSLCRNRNGQHPCLRLHSRGDWPIFARNACHVAFHWHLGWDSSGVHPGRLSEGQLAPGGSNQWWLPCVHGCDNTRAAAWESALGAKQGPWHGHGAHYCARAWAVRSISRKDRHLAHPHLTAGLEAAFRPQRLLLLPAVLRHLRGCVLCSGHYLAGRGVHGRVRGGCTARSGTISGGCRC